MLNNPQFYLASILYHSFQSERLKFFFVNSIIFQSFSLSPEHIRPF